jgi:hypothetical protein
MTLSRSGSDSDGGETTLGCPEVLSPCFFGRAVELSSKLLK